LIKVKVKVEVKVEVKKINPLTTKGHKGYTKSHKG
jgi:hypothetical protein